MPPQKSKYDAYFEITQEYEKCRKCPNIWLIRIPNQGTNKMRHHLKAAHPEDFLHLQAFNPDRNLQHLEHNLNFILATKQQHQQQQDNDGLMLQNHFQQFPFSSSTHQENGNCSRKRKSPPTSALEAVLQGDPPIKMEKPSSPPPTSASVDFSFPSNMSFLESLLENVPQSSSSVSSSSPNTNTNNNNNFSPYKMSTSTSNENENNKKEGENPAMTTPATELQRTNEEKFGVMNGKILSQFNRFMRVSVVALNQWAMDFDGNLKRVIESVKRAHSEGSTIRVGVELELSGYSCLDHFFEKDTETHCWESLIELLKFSKDLNMIIVTGMPVRFRAAIYNCMVVLAKGKVVLIHPKNAMCDDDVYRESRYFKSWKHGTQLQMFNIKQHGIDQDDVPFGHGIIETLDGIKVAIEICEEMWAAQSPSVLWALNGVDIICNGSASHHVLGKSAKRICQLVQDLSTKLGGVYLYSNLRGFDGDRIYFDGMSSIVQNGKIYKQINQFDLEDVAVESALLDLNKSATYRTKIASLGELSSRADLLPTITANIEVIQPHDNHLDVPYHPQFMNEREEIFHAPPAYLWHYLRRSTAAGYFLPLSGGADSGAVAAIVYLMCEKVCKAVKGYKDKGLPIDESLYFQGKPIEETDPKKLASRLFYTCYMKSQNSSKDTEDRAHAVAECIGANFSVQSIDDTTESLKNTFSKAHEINLSFDHPDYRARIALENIQARARMVLAYMNAQMLPVVHGLQGTLLVLSSSNVDESLVGYLTKYDCSSADINPIGSINKIDLKIFLQDFADKGHEPFHAIVGAKPSAELKPMAMGESPQTDEEDIGITYAQLHEIGLLRKPGYYGIFSTFFQLVSKWNKTPPTEIVEIVINFFTRYMRSRHKATVSTPALVSNIYCVDDQRTDHRPFVYPSMTYQFERLRDIASKMMEK